MKNSPERAQTRASLYRLILLTLIVEVGKAVQLQDQQHLESYLQKEMIHGFGHRHPEIRDWYQGLTDQERSDLHHDLFLLSQPGWS